MCWARGFLHSLGDEAGIRSHFRQLIYSLSELKECSDWHHSENSKQWHKVNSLSLWGEPRENF